MARFFVGDFCKKRVKAGNFRSWRWHADEIFVKVNSKLHYLWWAVDNEGEVLEFFVRKRRQKAGALKFLNKAMKRYGRHTSSAGKSTRRCLAVLAKRGAVAT